MTDNNGATSRAAIPWNRLRAWIDEQEAWEREHNSPAPLSSSQKSAIQTLLPPIPEPELGNEDYVSKLCQLAQASHFALPTYEFESVSKIETHQLKWRATCKLPWCDEVLPKKGFGIEGGEEAPSFQAKKKAKQFAAKQALLLLEGGNKPKPASKPSPPSPPVPPQAKRIKIKAEEESVSSDEEGPGVREKVAILAAKLGFDCPHYKIVPDGDRDNFWKGQPYFKQDARIPENLGYVHGIYGKQAARLEMAEKVLAWLTIEDRARRETMDRLLATLDAVSEEGAAI